MITFTADKLKQARDAGYTDDEIWGFTSQQDDRFIKAKDAGYSLDEVSGFFSEQQAPQEPATPAEPAPPVGTSFMEEVAAIPQAIRQAVDQPLEAMGETAEVLGAPSVGGALRGAVDAAEGYVPAAQRFMEPQEGEFQIGGFAPQFLPRAIVEQAGQIAGAIATRAVGGAVGGIAGATLGPKGAVAGAVAGQFLGPALFEMSQIVGPVARERAANQGREEPTTDDLAWAWSTAGASGALNAIGAKYLPNGDKLVGGLAKRIAASVAGEGTTEGLQSTVQQVGQSFLTEQGLQLKPKESFGEAIMGGGAGGATTLAAAPFTKASAAAETKVAAEQAASVAPETAQAVSEQANQVIVQAQAEETSETPEQRVARLQREAQEAAGIELEEEPPVSGLPPVEPTPPVTPTPEAAVAPVEPVVPEVVVEPLEGVGIAPPPPRQEFTDLINEDETSDDAYQRYQSQIDEIEDRLEAEGVDIVKLVDPTLAGAQNLIGQEGYTEMPPDLVEAYARREAVGAGQLAQSVGELTEALKNQNISEQDIKRVLDAYAIDVGKVDAFAQYKANEYTKAKVEAPPITQLERVAIALAAERGEMFDAVEDISKETLLDAGRAVKAIQDYFGVRPTEQQRAEFSRVSGVEFAALPPTPEAAPAAVEPTPVAPPVTPEAPATAETRFSQFIQPKERPDLAELPEFKSFEMEVRGVPVRFDIDTTKSDQNTLYLESFRVPRGERRQGIGREAMTNVLRWADENNVTLKGEALTAPADRQYRTPQEIREQGYMTPRELFQFYQTLGWERDPEGPKKTMGIPMVYRPKPAAEVAPTIPQLEPLRRVARAEQTEEDVAGLVDAGFAEVYNGQPVITQAGLDALPEAERPRLTPEARKIQIDTRTSEAAAEAISKNLRIGVDQVPVDVRMPAGWTLEGDIYVPPQPQELVKAGQPEQAITPPTLKTKYTDSTLERVSLPKASGQPNQARQALEAISKGNSPYAQLAQEIINAANTNPEISFAISNSKFTRSTPEQDRGRFKGRSFYEPAYRTISMNLKQAGDTRIAVHEIIHAIISHKLPNKISSTKLKGKKYKKALDEAIADQTLPKPLRDIIRGYVIAVEKMGADETLWGAGPDAGVTSQTLNVSVKYLGAPIGAQTKAQREGGRSYRISKKSNVQKLLRYLKENGITEVDVKQGFYGRGGRAHYDVIVANSDLEKIAVEKKQQGKHPSYYGNKGYDPTNNSLTWNIKNKIFPVANDPDAVVEYGFEYGLGNIDEFLSEALSNPEFQKALNEIEMESGKTVWQTIIDAIARILGIEVKAGSVLDVISRSAFELATEGDLLLAGGRAPTPAPTPEVREARREPAITPQQDRDYLDAVERGDLDAASRMVEAVARAAGYVARVYHGTPNFIGNVFDVGRRGQNTKARSSLLAFFFSDNQDVARSYLQNSLSLNEAGLARLQDADRAGEQGRPDLKRKIEKEVFDDEFMSRPKYWALQQEGQVLDVYVNPENFKRLEPRTYNDAEFAAEILKAKEEGYAGLVFEASLDAGADFTQFQKRSDVYAVFDSNLIKSAEAITRDDQGNIIPLSQRFQPEQDDIRYNPLGYDITTVVEDIKAGRTDGPLRAVNNVVKEASAFRDRVKAESLRRQQPRARGKAAILERIARERSSGKLSEDTAQALSDFVNSIRNEAIGDTAISIRGAGGASNFDFGQSLVSFFLTQDQPKIGARVGIHEFWHGLARFLPQKEVDQMTKDYTKALGAYLKKNPWFLAFVGRYSLTPEQFEAYKIFNPKEAETKLVPVLDREGNPVKYQIKYDADNYRYIMLDEWIAEKMTDLVRGKQAIPDTFMGKLAKIIRDFMAMIRSKLGRDPYQSFYNLVTDPNQKIDLQRMAGVARPFQIYQPQDYDYSKDISDQIRYAGLRSREDINREYTPNTDEERKAFEKASTNNVLARNPQLAVAAVRLKNGEINAGEYADLVDAIDPFTPKGADPIPTDDKIKQYIQENFIGKVGFIDENGNPRLQSGSEYEFRIDINTYNKSTRAGDTVYNITAHKPVPETSKRVGDAVAYIGIASVSNPTFMTRSISGKGAAIDIATGAGKFPLATVKGNYKPITELPSDINDPNVWTEAGYNPVRSSFFVDTRSKQAVVGGSEAIMVGSRVFVKNAKLEARPTGITYGRAYSPVGLEGGAEYRAEGFPTFTEGTPEAATLKEMEATMAKVDAASEAKGGKPETYKISEIASVWMDSGLGERELQDAIVEYTNLTPANAAKVAKAIARQYDIQQSIATAFLETQTGLSVEALPEGVTLPKEVDPDRPKPVMQRLFDVFMGVRVPPVKIEVNEKTALKQQIRLKAAANRAAKAEQKRTAEEVVEIIKAMELLGPVRPKQVQALAKRAARVIWTNEKSVEAFSEYATKVVENANYDADLREAKDAQKRAKQLSTQKKVAMSPQRQILEDVGKVPVNKLDDPRMFAEAVNYYLRGFKDVLSPDYVVIPDAEMESYLSGAQSEALRNQRDLDREANQRLAKKYGIDPEQVNEMMESIDIIQQIEAQENREALNNLLTEKAIETQQGLRGYNTDNLSVEQRPIVAAMLKIDPKALDAEERQRFIRITNNIIYNNQTNGAEYFVAVAKGQQSAREAAKDSTMIAKNRAWINLLPRFVSERMQRGWALELQSVADTFRNAFGKGAMAKVYDAIGMLDLNLGFTKANNVIDEIQEKIAEFHRNLEKKYKAAARNQDGLLAEGVVGFLIQSVPKKDEVSSINQRRDLIRQDIANRKAATMEPDRVAMGNRIEAILNQIDGESIEAILNNMKREFPANHESLVWYKDTLLPQYKDFLKNFDENFNDQANNYENPNYLTIGFTSAGPSLAITPEEQNLFYDQVSLRPKQSAYTIKRVDYTELPKDATTGKPKEIEFNLRRNVFNGLSDQINKAYTSSGWQRIASFMKTPEAEVVFGGSANKDFFIERLNRLRLSRMRRGSMGRGGAIEKAVDSLSIISRKLGTGIALGGIYQWIKQPPDQLITALGSGGRADLLAKNIAPSTQKAARELLNKFSIGRRGDASAGYKYINQMEGHQNRLERYFSESKWDQAKEQAGKIADVWMVALKSSDFLAASAAWMTYYEGELNKQDIKIDDWSKEAELIESDPKRRQAAAFAEQMTDIYQGSSDPTSMATFAQSGKSGWENLVKAIFVPFNSFAIQQRMRIYSDARDAINGSKSGAGGLAGTIGGLILFHTTKRFVIPAISGAGIAVLYGLMGVDMDEPDEEKQKEEANKNWRQFLADITGNLLVGGTPQIIESQFIDAMNRASYLVALQLENDSILNDEGEIMSYDQYSKERSPFYRYKSFDNAMSLGMLDIGLGQAEQVALQTKMLATPEEMEMYTPEEQRMLYFSALSEWLYLMRLNDADFARLVSKARRDMIKAAKDREKELQRIRSGR